MKGNNKKLSHTFSDVDRTYQLLEIKGKQLSAKKKSQSWQSNIPVDRSSSRGKINSVPINEVLIKVQFCLKICKQFHYNLPYSIWKHNNIYPNNKFPSTCRCQISRGSQIKRLEVLLQQKKKNIKNNLSCQLMTRYIQFILSLFLFSESQTRRNFIALPGSKIHPVTSRKEKYYKFCNSNK